MGITYDRNYIELRSPKRTAAERPVYRGGSTREADEAARAILAMRKSHGIIDESSVGLFGGMAIGATVGSVAGPPGAIAGAIVGTIVGAAAGLVWGDIKHLQAMKDERLDREMGIDGGHIGEASPNAPQTRLGMFSAAAMGAGGTNSDYEDQGQDGGPVNGPHAHGV